MSRRVSICQPFVQPFPLAQLIPLMCVCVCACVRCCSTGVVEGWFVFTQYSPLVLSVFFHGAHVFASIEAKLTWGWTSFGKSEKGSLLEDSRIHVGGV